MQLDRFRVMARKPGQRGFTLVETLITMVILSFGLLGVASVQLSAMSKSRSVFERNQATLLANELIEQIRSNLPAAAAGNYDFSGTVSAHISAPSCSGASANCSAADMAAAELADWQRRAAAQLIDAVVTIDIAVNAGVASSVTLTMSWSGSQMNVRADLS